MRILILSDLEGISGIVNEKIQALPSAAMYQEARRFLMSDVNAAVRGAVEGGADNVTVYDTHCDGLNIVMQELPEKASALLGNPIVVPEEFIRTFDAKMLVGYHTMAETPGGLLCHTYPLQIRAIVVNGLTVGEIGMEILVASYLGKPTILVTGDSGACAEARDLVRNIETVPVKKPLGRTSASCENLKDTAEKIRESARRAVSSYRTIDVLRLDGPYRVEVCFYDELFARKVFNVEKFYRKQLKDGWLVAEDANLFQLWSHLKDAIWINL